MNNIANALYNLEAEMDVLKALCCGENKAFSEFSPDDFYAETLRECFSAARMLDADGKEINQNTLSPLISASAREVAADLFAVYLPEDSAHFSAAKKTVKDCAARRRLASILREAENMISDFMEPRDIISYTDFAIGHIQTDDSLAFCPSVGDLMPAFYEGIERKQEKNGIPGVSTGFSALDTMTGGLLPGNLYVLAARPGMGKSAFASAISVSAAKKGVPVLYFSLEMDRMLVLQRMVSASLRIKNSGLKTGALNFSDWEKLSSGGFTDFAKMPIYIDDDPGLSSENAISAALRLSSALSKKGQALGLVVIDYLQIMQGKSKDRRQVVEDNCRGAKLLARRLDCPVLLLSQLTRALETANDKRPALYHLRESGAIEQDADMVAFLYRESYYNKTFESDETELIIAKQRDGALGTVKINFVPDYTAFEDIDPDAFVPLNDSVTWEDLEARGTSPVLKK